MATVFIFPMRKPRGKYTREKIKEREEKQKKRRICIKAIEDGEVAEEFPVPLLPEIFKDIEDRYWEVLKQAPDPGDSSKKAYPLYLIPHRIISAFLSGTQNIDLLFPVKRKPGEKGKRKLGALPARRAVYTLLRSIN